MVYQLFPSMYFRLNSKSPPPLFLSSSAVFIRDDHKPNLHLHFLNESNNSGASQAKLSVCDKTYSIGTIHIFDFRFVSPIARIMLCKYLARRRHVYKSRHRATHPAQWHNLESWILMQSKCDDVTTFVFKKELVGDCGLNCSTQTYNADSEN